jgi:hypothetical protein
MNLHSSAKITMLNRSMRCFVFGLLGLLPAIGLPFAFAALWIAGQVRVQEKEMWNAAKPYRVWGVICAIVGTLFWFLIVALIAYHSATNGGRGGISSMSGGD